MNERIIIEIDENAATTVKVEGCPGAGCQNLTKVIEEALGETTKDTKTHEYHQRATQGSKQTAGQ